MERAINRFLEGRTVIAIAHRLHTARDADRVIVMRDGRITESGPHRDLVARDGDYVITLGCGNVNLIIPQVLEALATADAGE